VGVGLLKKKIFFLFFSDFFEFFLNFFVFIALGKAFVECQKITLGKDRFAG